MKTDVTFNYLMSVCKQTPKKNVQLVNCPSENTADTNNVSSDTPIRQLAGRSSFMTSNAEDMN